MRLWLVRFCWEDSFYFDKCLPIGASSSCKIWESFSTALEWIAKSKLAISGVLHLLDDFLLIDKTFSACEQNLSRFLAMCDDLGVPMAPEKTMGPSSVLCFAGIELDTDKMEARLSEEKLRKWISLNYEFLKRKKVSLKEMQSLIGLLNFTCSVVIPGAAGLFLDDWLIWQLGSIARLI